MSARSDRRRDAVAGHGDSDAGRRVVAALVDARLVSPDNQERALAVASAAVKHPHDVDPMRHRLTEIAGYVGACLLIASATLLVSDHWADFGATARVLVLAGVAAILVLTSFLTSSSKIGRTTSRGHNLTPTRRRLSSVLWTGAALATAGAAATGLSELGTPHQPEWLVPFAIGFSVTTICAVGYVLAPTSLGQASVAGGVGVLVPSLLSAVGLDDAPAFGWAFVLVGFTWTLLAESGLWRERHLALLVGATAMLTGAQLQNASSHPWIGYGVTLLLGALGFLTFTIRREWPYLALGVAGLTIGASEGLMDLAGGSRELSGVLLAAGATLVTVSVVGLYTRQHQDH